MKVLHFSGKFLLCGFVIILGVSFLFFFTYFNNRQIPKSPSASVPFISLSTPKPAASVFTVDARWMLLLTGDVIPARVVNQKMVAKQNFNWPLENIAHVLKDADITLINLESPLIANCPVTNEGMNFCGDNRFSQALADAGVDVANLSNNHSLNHGWEGIKETQEALAAVGIETTGFTVDNCFYSSSDAPKAQSREVSLENISSSQLHSNNNIYCSSFFTKKIQGTTVGFLGYNAVGQRLDREVVEAQIRAADKLVDVLIVSVHWGKEYTHEPLTDSIAQDDPKELGRLFVDWGADVVAGNHPHWYQGMEWYAASLSAESFDSAQDKLRRSVNAKPIFYALGNTVFDQEWSPETKQGVLVRIPFTHTTIKRGQIEIIPIGLRDYGQAFLLEGIEKEEIRRFYDSFIQP